MKSRRWILTGAFISLVLIYVVFFTDWLRPAPIEIASQVRFAIQPPRFGRPVPKPPAPGQHPVTNHLATNHAQPVVPFERVGLPAKGGIDPAPGGVANVTFSLDGWYRLTEIRVEDVPADGSKPQTLWQLVGKSRLLDSLLYGRVPEGMHPILQGSTAEPLKPGIPYRLMIEAGRRRGTNNFRTVELRATD